jgi:hypothetical protein
MFDLFFGSVMSVITTVFVLALLAFAVVAFVRRCDIGKWGRLILIFYKFGSDPESLSEAKALFLRHIDYFNEIYGVH